MAIGKYSVSKNLKPLEMFILEWILVEEKLNLIDLIVSITSLCILQTAKKINFWETVLLKYPKDITNVQCVQPLPQETYCRECGRGLNTDIKGVARKKIVNNK